MKKKCKNECVYLCEGIENSFILHTLKSRSSRPRAFHWFAFQTHACDHMSSKFFGINKSK